MNGPGNPGDRAPKKPDDWSELEKDPKFQNILLALMHLALMDKKFSADFMKEYYELASRREEKESNELSSTRDPVEIRIGTLQGVLEEIENPLLPEVAEFEDKVSKAESMEEMLELARQEKINFTQEEMRKIKEPALAIWKIENES